MRCFSIVCNLFSVKMSASSLSWLKQKKNEESVKEVR